MSTSKRWQRHILSSFVPNDYFRLVRTTLGMILLTAAAFKVYDISLLPLAPQGLRVLPSTWGSLIVFEICLGIWMLIGVYPRTTWAIGVLCFGVFAGVSLAKGMSGATTCGCFGDAPLSPWFVFGIDVLALSFLCVFPPSKAKKRNQSLAAAGTPSPC